MVIWVMKICFYTSFVYSCHLIFSASARSHCFCLLLCPSIFPGGSDGKASAYNVGDPDSIPGSGRSPGEGNSNPVQYSCLENPRDGGAW